MKKAILGLMTALTISLTLNAQVYVSTTPANKNAMIEEFTGVRCPNCPDGHTVLAAILAANPGRAFGIGYHPTNSSYTEPYAGSPDFRRVYLDAFYSTPYCGTSRFMPSAFVNRREWQTDEKIQSRGDWTAEATTIIGEASPLNVGMGAFYNPDTKILTIDAEVYFTSTVSDALSIYVVFAESNLIAEQVNGGTSYVHKHVFRESLVAQWGDPISGPTTGGALFSDSYTFDNTTDNYNMAECEVSVFVYNTVTEEVISGYQVEVEVQTSGVKENAPETFTAGLFPNPVDEQASIVANLPEGGELSWTLTDLMGRGMAGGSWGSLPAGTSKFQLDGIDRLAAGLYLLRIQSGEEAITIRMNKN